MIKKMILNGFLGSVCVLGFSSPVLADATGNWVGSAEWTYDGSAVPCRLSVRFEETAQELRRHKGQLICDVVTMSSDPLTWVKKSNDLYWEDSKVGTISSQGFQVTEAYDENVQVMTELNVQTGAYHEVWTRNKDQAVIYDIVGRLKRQP